MLFALLPLLLSALGVASAASTPVLAYSSPKPFLGLEQGAYDNSKNDGVVMFIPGEQSSSLGPRKLAEPFSSFGSLKQDSTPAEPSSY